MTSFHEFDIDDITVNIKKDLSCWICGDKNSNFYFSIVVKSGFVVSRCKKHKDPPFIKLKEQDIFLLRIHGKL